MNTQAIIFIAIVVVLFVLFCKNDTKYTNTRKDTKTLDRRNGNSISDKMYNAQANTKTKTTYTAHKPEQKGKK